MDVTHVGKDELGFAVDPASGDRVSVHAVRFNGPHRATGSDIEFVLERSKDGVCTRAEAYESEAQAFQMLTAYPREREVSVFGTVVTRTGWGIPDALIVRDVPDLTPVDNAPVDGTTPATV